MSRDNGESRQNAMKPRFYNSQICPSSHSIFSSFYAKNTLKLKQNIMNLNRSVNDASISPKLQILKEKFMKKTRVSRRPFATGESTLYCNTKSYLKTYFSVHLIFSYAQYYPILAFPSVSHGILLYPMVFFANKSANGQKTNVI